MNNNKFEVLNHKKNRDVYITKATLHSLSKKFKINDYKNLIKKIDDLKIKLPIEEYFSYPEIISIAKINILISSFNDELIRSELESSEMKVNRKERKIYPSKPPSYHCKKDCEFIRSDYKNYNIPIEIKENDIEAYRGFFLENEDLFNEYPDRFYARAEIKFNVKINNVKKYEGVNSGLSTLSFDEHCKAVNEINKMIDEMKEKSVEDFCKVVYMPFNRIKYLNEKYNSNSFNDTLKSSDKLALDISLLKNKIRNHIIEILIIDSFKTDMVFKESTMIALGARCCKACCR